MRKTIVFAAIAAMALPAIGSRRVTIEEMRTILAAQQASGKSDQDEARQIGDLELTEKLSPPMLAGLDAEFRPGPKTVLALTLLSDLSAFLDPPENQTVPDSAPDTGTQRAMIRMAMEYVASTLQRLPNFLATRATRSFDDNPAVSIESPLPPLRTSLRLEGRFSQEITYRDGHEALNNASLPGGAKRGRASDPPGLTSWGEFGPVLAVVLADSARGKLAWSRWERTDGGVAAVFRYEVPDRVSHYKVNYCCVRSLGGPDLNHPWIEQSRTANSYDGTPGYHGTLSLDPATGAILRVTLQSDLKDSDPIVRNDIEVQYGPVEIGGKSYICPIRSVAVSAALVGSETSSRKRMVMRVNDVTFIDYHRFGSTVRILPSVEEQQ